MRIISHRGYWRSRGERNAPVAFDRSFALGFGTETDLRDADGRLVIAHDPPAPGAAALPAARVLAMHRAMAPDTPLALNVKADGLQDLLVRALEEHAVRDAFVFDMSVPDMRGWLAAGVPVFTRQSEIEPEPVLYREAAGVWLDAFAEEWWEPGLVRAHLEAGKRVCIVSPELHGREHRRVWDVLAGSDLAACDALLLCTDHPEDARRALRHAH